MQPPNRMEMIRYFHLYLLFFLIVAGKVISQDCKRTLPQSLDPEAWTWMVAIMKVTRDAAPSLMCSGVMIDQRHVLTVAHCFNHGKNTRDLTDDFIVRIGNIDASLGESYEIKDIKVHKKFDSSKNDYNNDIALVTLATDIKIEDFTPICLPSQSIAKKNLTGMSVTNIGYTDYVHPDSSLNTRPILKMSSKIITSNHKCSESLKHIRLSFVLQKQIVCTQNGTPMCSGSSGGPLLLEYKARWYVVGLTLFGYTCEPNPFPEGYTRVSEYLQWIKENTN